MFLSQSHCVESVLKRFGHYDSKPCATPFDPNYKLKKNMGDSVSQLEYSRVIGSLMYITNCTRPDIAYSINRLARYTNNLAKEHWFAFVRVLRYFKHTIKYGLHYIRYPSVIEGFSDANWISDSLESKSTSEYIFNLGGAAISWKSSKQTCIARSTMESEFIALDNAGEEAEWLRNFLEDIPIWLKPVTPICIHCDSQKALARAKNAVYNGLFHHHPNTESHAEQHCIPRLANNWNPSIGSGTLMKKPLLLSPTWIAHIPWPIPSPPIFLSQFVLISFNHSISIKLDQNNFLIWRQQVEVAIKGYKLSKFINGINTALPKFLSSMDETNGKINQNFSDWEQQDQLLVYWLLASMSEGLLMRMVGCVTSFQIWEKLEVFFAAQTRAKIDQFKKQLKSS
ncbi:Retrovirus-related Pol polyprotein from transposon TNT 1-94 [Vitis vinifera]|uniref:Retrovirus-related Pol polyprotein from transposon TNT 1-94 n=1 Tax=Vitis vinifera TaxID=29760 RepID=A0A438CWU1_VITVI|nr:Retrovirus-related Pol polyprotein from transposon TNT 1-94 [Vitis vinifera]